MTEDEIKKIATLALIQLDEASLYELTKDISFMMQFVNKLQEIDTHDISPLFHPLDIHQRLRDDVSVDEDRIKELEQIAPAFKDRQYLVPKVIDTGK